MKEYLESKFTKEMTWENYGKFWHIDHIIPIDVFNLLDINEQLMAFHWSNLQPLQATENIIKSNKILPEVIYRYWNGTQWIDSRELKLLPAP